MKYTLKFNPKTMTEEEAKHIEKALKIDFNRTNELYAYRIIKTGEDDKTDYTVENFYNIWLRDFAEGVKRMCYQNLGKPGNTPIQNKAYAEIMQHRWKIADNVNYIDIEDTDIDRIDINDIDEMDFLFKICCEFGFRFKQDRNDDDNSQIILFGDFDKCQLEYWGVEPWQICYAYIKCNELELIDYNKPIKEICTDLLNYIFNELN